MKHCLLKNDLKRIVFTGDSHSRFRTYHWVTRLHGTCPNCSKNQIKTIFNDVPRVEWMFDARGTRWPATFPMFIRRPNEIYVESRTRRSVFSYELSNSILEGDLYIMNFGHWILREMTFNNFIRAKITSFIEAIQKMNQTLYSSEKLENSHVTTTSKKRFLWVNNLSLKWREDHQVINWTMTPAPSTTSYLNSILDNAMKDVGIQVVDAFQISNPRLSAVHDATHYAKVFPDSLCGGSVEHEVTNVIINALCNEE